MVKGTGELICVVDIFRMLMAGVVSEVCASVKT